MQISSQKIALRRNLHNRIEYSTVSVYALWNQISNIIRRRQTLFYTGDWPQGTHIDQYCLAIYEKSPRHRHNIYFFMENQLNNLHKDMIWIEWTLLKNSGTPLLDLKQTFCYKKLLPNSWDPSKMRRMAACSGKRNVTVWHQSVRPSVPLFVRPVGILTVTHQGTARDAASVHFGPTIRISDILSWSGWLICVRQC